MSKLIIALYVLATSSALVVLKWGAKNGPPISLIHNHLRFNLNWFVFFGLLLYLISFALYVFLISKYDLGYIIPLASGFVYVLIYIASYAVFNEVFTITKIAGIALIVAGILFLNLKS